MLVTVHLAEGQTAKQLIVEFTELAGGVRPRTSSGRFGVLVDSELAYRYLAARRVPAPQLDPEPVLATNPEPATAARPPAKKAAAKKAQPKAAVKEGE